MWIRRSVFLLTLALCSWVGSAQASVGLFFYDANMDGFITTDDPLAIINHLNANGSGCASDPGYNYNLFFDANLDGCNSPIDALVIINFLGTLPWQNPSDPFDVNDDGFVTPLDALIVINELNASGAGPFTLAEACVDPYRDADGDNELTNNDALVIINFLNSP